MRCKAGDLVMTVWAQHSDRVGSIVRVVRECSLPGADWWIEYGGALYHALDSQFRPLRDSDGEDEILRIAGKPKYEDAPARLTRVVDMAERAKDGE